MTVLLSFLCRLRRCDVPQPRKERESIATHDVLEPAGVAGVVLVDIVCVPIRHIYADSLAQGKSARLGDPTNARTRKICPKQNPAAPLPPNEALERKQVGLVP
jgi:hypothetical protein